MVVDETSLSQGVFPSTTNFHSRPDCNSAAEVLSFALRIVPSAIPFLFLICVVWTYNDSRKEFHRFGQIPRNCKPRTFDLSFLRGFCFARIRLDPSGSQVLHHDSILCRIFFICPWDPALQRQCTCFQSTTSRKRKVNDRKKCRKLKRVKREREVDGEVGERERESLNVRMRHDHDDETNEAQT